MQLDLYVNTLGRHLKQNFSGRVRKLSVDGDFTCPNRDGSIGKGGCTFCNVDAFVKPQQQLMSIGQQLEARKAELKHKDIRYLAYFQAYTSTYAEVEYLRGMYQQALADDSVVGLCIGTRPDCVPDAVLEMLAEYQAQGKEVWLELGVQTAHDHTLKKINRGHDFAAFQQAVARAHQHGLNVCAHLILGLPGEQPEHYMQSLKAVLAEDIAGIKLHPLHVVEGSTMAKAWQAGRLETMTQQHYVEQAVKLIRHTPAHVVYHRVSAHARPPVLLAPNWCQNKWLALTDIAKKLAAEGPQGSALATK
ncbi:TIGR01212 family radical SAM protein [Agarivorans aestuarii]|uniref:TIGR01212 family radical SAM protein n=1 Tax=Agarivorans aestuarii TaxID=1563703 RepID=A0ABU7G7I0_9ALTE|nr:TIGR01212 family radical SAM protein [Agarivorans aestuarii]MEE1675286.1 TIGR01212 family radical SAM protein [Agarivorans aestuarii]